MNYQIRFLDYDLETDELDLLINSDQPQAAEAVETDLGIYVRRDFATGQVVGAFIRGYRHFAQRIQGGEEQSLPTAEREGLRDVVAAIIKWQREVGQLSRELAAHLRTWPPQPQLLEAQLEAPT